MQVIIALRWAAQHGDTLPEALDAASQDVLDRLYSWQRRGAGGRGANGAGSGDDETGSTPRGPTLRAGHSPRAMA